VCFAVGAVLAIAASGPQSSALVERFDGHSWRVSLRLPDTVSSLGAISCVSRSFCLAVGHDGPFPAPTVALRWNGRSWSRVSAASPPSGGEGDDLLGVDCLSRRDCWVVGGSNIDLVGTVPSSLIERYDGSALHAVTAPDTAAALTTIGCPGATSCYATAGTGSLERLQGSGWRLAPQPAVFDGNGETITCRTSATCWILGSARTNGALVARHLAHGAFRAAPTQPISSSLILHGSDCATPTDCWAVGSAIETSLMPTFAPLAERWDGSRWVAARTRSSYRGQAELTSVSCTPDGVCVSVGRSLLSATPSALVAVIRPQR
jgi:hypothetical protein